MTPLVPILQENNVFLFRHWEAMRDTIADAFEASGERHEALLAAITLALDFQTRSYEGIARRWTGRRLGGRDDTVPDAHLVRSFQLSRRGRIEGACHRIRARFPVPTAGLHVEQSRWSVKPQGSVCVR